MSAIVLATFLASASAASAPRLVLELASSRSSSFLDLTFRARGLGDVYFKSNAVRLEIRSAHGALLRYGCSDKRGLPAAPVRLRPGQTVSKTIDSTCYHPSTGTRYEVTAVFEDDGDDFRGEPPAGAAWATGPIQSNRIATRFGAPRNKALQADDRLGRSDPSNDPIEDDRGRARICHEKNAALRPEFDKAVAEHSNCKTSSDCAVVTPGCPFGCYVAVARTEVEEIKRVAHELVSREGSDCRCTYKCTAAPDASCTRGSCTIQSQR